MRMSLKVITIRLRRLKLLQMHKEGFEHKLQAYNEYYQDKPHLQIKQVKKDERGVVLEGCLRVFWGVVQSIRFKIDDDKKDDAQISTDTQREEDTNTETQTDAKGQSSVSRSHSSVMMRKKKMMKRKRFSIINGHLFKTQTSMFTPSSDSFTNVHISSDESSGQVLKLLLNKFKVDNSPTEFCLCAIRSSGETSILKDSGLPLVERILYGPIEDDVKICLIERYRVMQVNEEAAYYVGLPDSVLQGFLNKYLLDEQLEMQMVRDRYHSCKVKLEGMMKQLIKA